MTNTEATRQGLEVVFPASHHLAERVFYDPAAGQYYDSGRDMYLAVFDPHEEAKPMTQQSQPEPAEGKVTKTEVESYLERLNAAAGDENRRYKCDYRGRKYWRIVAEYYGHDSAHCFVEVATGDIWKADGWKRPALNFRRGNIRTQQADAMAVTKHGH